MRIAITTILILLISSCGVIKTRDKQMDQVSQIKKAAIVAFTVDLPARSGLSLSANSGKVSGKSGGGSLLTKTSIISEQMYSAISEAFIKKINWKFVSKDQFIETAAYKLAYEKTMTGFQNKYPAGEGLNRFLIPNLMDFDCMRLLRIEGRDQLMKELKVDALITVHVRGFLEGTSVMGIGPNYPNVKVSFQVYRRGIENVVWFDSLEGKKAKESVGSTGLTIDEEKVAEYSLTSVKEALTKLE